MMSGSMYDMSGTPDMFLTHIMAGWMSTSRHRRHQLAAHVSGRAQNASCLPE